MDGNKTKPDQRGGKDRRKADGSAYDGPDRRERDRRQDKPAPK